MHSFFRDCRGLKPDVCAACGELGEHFSYSFPEDKQAPLPASFAHLDTVARSVMSLRDELVRCDHCQTYFSWNRMWDNDVYSTPLDYVDIYRLTPKEAQDWLKREKQWVRKLRADEKREIRSLEKLWFDEVVKLGSNERTLFEYLVQKHSRGVDGEMIKKECGLDPSVIWEALDSLEKKNMLRKTPNTASKETANYQISRWRYS